LKSGVLSPPATQYTKSAFADLFLATEGWLRALVGAVLTAVAPKLTCTHNKKQAWKVGHFFVYSLIKQNGPDRITWAGSQIL
jgi:hypothetical protein